MEDHIQIVSSEALERTKDHLEGSLVFKYLSHGMLFGQTQVRSQDLAEPL